MNAQADPLAGGTEVTSQVVPFSVVGDFVRGTYTSKKAVTTQYGPNTVYEIKLAVGLWHNKEKTKKITGEAGEYVAIFGGKNQVDGLFAKSKLGDIVALQLKEEKPTKKGNPWKNFLAKTYGADPEYMGEDSSAEGEKVEDESFDINEK